MPLGARLQLTYTILSYLTYLPYLLLVENPHIEKILAPQLCCKSAFREASFQRFQNTATAGGAEPVIGRPESRQRTTRAQIARSTMLTVVMQRHVSYGQLATCRVAMLHVHMQTSYIFINVYIYIYMYSTYVYTHMHISDFFDVCINTCMHACMHACKYVCMHACQHACMYACMHACMDACMHVCMYVPSSV